MSVHYEYRDGFGLVLADGSAWQILPGHDEAVPVVQALGQIMQLSAPERRGRPLVVVTKGHDPAVVLPADSGIPLVCDVGAGVEIAPDLFPIQVSRLALSIARQTQPYGGLLLHGALAEYTPHPTPYTPSPLLSSGEGRGLGGEVRSAVLFAGPGTVGKTTASNRLPPPWRSLCDDTTLVVRNAQGQYWAHPWPTWSRFYGNGPGGSWDVQRAVPLRAIFFLRQDPVDRVEPLSAGEALAGLAESVPQVAGPMVTRLDEAEEQAIRQEWLSSASALAPAIPAFRLHISLTGAFWKEIERVLPDLPAPPLPPAPSTDDRSQPASFPLRITDYALRFTSVVYTGPSMNPTLRQPDVLTVVPYGDRPIHAGDVVCFRPPQGDHNVVHRVISVSLHGIRTRGDNNPREDEGWLQPSDVLGQVVAARDSRGERRIAGGWFGRLTFRGVVFGRGLWRLGGKLLHGAYYGLSRTGLFRRLLPSRLRPRIYVFRARRQTVTRLMMGRREIGRLDSVHGWWQIARPFRLFLDMDRLPHLKPPQGGSRYTRPAPH